MGISLADEGNGGALDLASGEVDEADGGGSHLYALSSRLRYSHASCP